MANLWHEFAPHGPWPREGAAIIVVWPSGHPAVRRFTRVMPPHQPCMGRWSQDAAGWLLSLRGYGGAAYELTPDRLPRYWTEIDLPEVTR